MNKISVNQRSYQLESAPQGFTLIELILYIALITIFMSGAILFAWDIIYGRVKSSVQQEVSQNLRLAAKRIVYEVRNAAAITAVTGSQLCLSTDHDPLVFYLSSNRLMIGWGGSCTSPAVSYPLTSNQVVVSVLDFNDLSSTNSKNIRFTITVESTGDRQEWQKTQTYTSSVELRSN